MSDKKPTKEPTSNNLSNATRNPKVDAKKSTDITEISKK
jgi:hypothetical protein